MFTCELQCVFRSPDGRNHSTSTDLARPTTGLEPMQFQLASSLENVFETWVCVYGGAFLTKRTSRLIYIPQHPLLFPLISRWPPQFSRQFMPTAMIRMEKLELVSHSCKILSQESRMMDQLVDTQVTANARVGMMGAPSKVCYIITSLTIRMFLTRFPQGHPHFPQVQPRCILLPGRHHVDISLFSCYLRLAIMSPTTSYSSFSSPFSLITQV